MNEINEYYVQAELAQAAYATLSTGEPSQSELLKVGMTFSQAENFASQWRVVAQYNHSETIEWIDELGITHEVVTSNGLSATVFENVDGQRYLAARGTEITDLNDIATDVIDIGALGTAEHQAQYAALSAQVQTWLDNDVLLPGFTVAGHSLGGFLATNLALDIPADVAHTYLYNAPGVTGVINGDLLGGIVNALSPGTPIAIPAVVSITNIVAADDVVSLVGLYVAPPIVLTVESQSPIGAHFIAGVTDALAVYSLFATIDPSVSIETISGILNAFPGDTENILESALAAAGAVYGKSYPCSETDRDIYYTNLYELQNVVAAGGQGTIVSLANLPVAEISAMAKSDPAALFALLQLSPIAITGMSQSYVPNDGSLDVENYSAQWFEDRASFLFYRYNKSALPRMEGSITFEDFTNPDMTAEANSYSRQGDFYKFGSAAGEELGGWDGNDHLYGMDGEDKLQGLGGDDYLEGGKGQDALSGGIGNDTFVVIGTDSDYDTFDGGADIDTIRGSDGDDTIRVHDFNPASSVEFIDGHLGYNTIAGTDLNDTIDLSQTIVLNIDKIDGGGGVDKITGSAGNDIIYGGAGGDTLNGGGGENWLYGGTGMDTYIVGEGINHLIDEDRLGIIKDQQGNVLNGGVWQKVGTGQYQQLVTATTATMNSPFTIQLGEGQQVVLESFTSGDYGITLVDSILPATTADTTLIGAADVDDTLGDTGGNDLIQGLGGDDLLYGGAGGNDRLEGGAGRDNLQAGDGDDVLVGGSERDIFLANFGSDRLYADEELSVAAAVAQGEGTASGLQGEWLDGRAGDDTVVGGAGDDLLLGGRGDDILIGGAGNDNIDGDLETISVGRDWVATRSVGNNTYSTSYSHAAIIDPGEGGNDVIYSGGGDDWIDGSDVLVVGLSHFSWYLEAA